MHHRDIALVMSVHIQVGEREEYVSQWLCSAGMSLSGSAWLVRGSAWLVCAVQLAVLSDTGGCCVQLDTCAGSEAGVKARGIDRAARWDVEGVEWREELGWGHRLADGVGVAGKALRYRWMHAQHRQK